MTALLPEHSIEARRTLSIGIIGAGRLGAALADALRLAGYTRIRLATRADAHATVEACRLVFVTVPDRVIREAVEALPWRAGQGVVHTSGALGLDALDAAAARGALRGCLHPLQTFPGATAPEDNAARFRGIVCGVEGGTPLGDLLTALVADLGGRALRLDGVDRALYHAAAVLVSNDVVALMAAATRTWEQAGLPVEDAREALEPLLLAAASNVARLPLELALTGPIARGDISTVQRHLEALAGDADLSATYRALGRELLRLDLSHAPEVSAALAALLRD